MKKCEQLPSISELPLPIKDEIFFSKLESMVNNTFDNNHNNTFSNQNNFVFNNQSVCFNSELPNNYQLITNQNLITIEPQRDKKIIEPIKGIWSHEEDEKLKAAVMETSPIVWEIIASKVPGRSPIQCKERWLYRLHPDVNKAKFEKWEDDLIISERKKIGNSWTYISTKLKGRTSCAVKNRWYSVLRKRKK
ncbi:hypothetical protein M9Y10_026667 [Tritrichomonas musculus]|uniref:Myb-like DNA-binding domain containing protein n=1 Tax=Tritrichomonas musculus TaxID=1915356 RepID=A0ABR2H7L8_9EUKA